jgi:hypothetical protein
MARLVERARVCQMIDETFAGRLEKCVSSESMRAAKFPPNAIFTQKLAEPGPVKGRLFGR